MPYNLTLQYGPTPQGEERLVLETGGQPLAIAIVDISVPDFTLGWPVSSAYGPADVLENWLSRLLPDYGTQAESMTLEFYIREHFTDFSVC